MTRKITYVAGLWCFIINILLWNNIIFAQEDIGFKLKIINTIEQTETFNSKKYPDSLAIVNALKPIIQSYQKQGFLTANIDSIAFKGDTAIAYLYKKDQFKLGEIGLDSIPKGILNQLGISAKQWQNQHLDVSKIQNLMGKVVQFAEQNGHPFAMVGFENIKLQDNHTLNADLYYKPGPLVYIDSIEIRGNVELDRSFFLAYLGLKQGQLYNETTLKNISKKINELAFVKEAAPWDFNFTILGHTLIIYLTEKKSNQINALLGFQPSNEETKRFLWTADVQLLLNNTLGYGETFAATYKNLQAKSPQLDISTIVPYILGSRIALDGKFEYFKRDTLFNRTGFELGVRYQFSEKDYLRISYQQTNNRVPSPDTAFVRINKRLSSNADVRSRGFGVTYMMDRTDYSLNPFKGWSAMVNVAALQRYIRPNNAILGINDGFDYNTLYDTVNNQPSQYKITGYLQYFQPLAKQLTIRAAYEAAYISGNNLFQNELFQIGGFKTLRGFDERSLFVNQYHIVTLELKALLSQRSYFNVFSDFGKTTSQYQMVNISHNPISFGLGLTLENKTGIFNIIVANGKLESERFQFRNTKIHFGYVSYF